MNDTSQSDTAVVPPEPAASPDLARRNPVFGTIALVFAVGTLFFPRFLVALPVLIAIGFAAAALFRRERWIALPITAIVMGVGLLLLSSQPLSASHNTAALEDIDLGKETGGSLHGDFQFVCFDEGDALRGEVLPGTSDDKTTEIRKALLDQDRCALTAQGANYDMTADGKEQFTTPHGVVELWAAHDYAAAH